MRMRLLHTYNSSFVIIVMRLRKRQWLWKRMRLHNLDSLAFLPLQHSMRKQIVHNQTKKTGVLPQPACFFILFLFASLPFPYTPFFNLFLSLLCLLFFHTLSPSSLLPLLPLSLIFASSFFCPRSK